MQDSSNPVNVTTLAGTKSVAIQDTDAFLIAKAIKKSQAIFDLIESRHLEVFCLIDANDDCKHILD